MPEAPRDAAKVEMETLVQHLPGVAVHILDRDLRYRYSGGEALSKVGLSHDELVGRYVPDVVGGELGAAFEAMYARVLAGSTEEMRGHFGGHDFEVTAAPLAGPDGDVERILVLSLDVTERVSERVAMVAAEARFRRTVESAPDAIFIQAEERFAYLNPAALELFGARTAEELVGTPVVDRFLEEDREQVAARIRALNVERRSLSNAVKRVRRPDGSVVFAEFSGVPFDHQGKPGALVFGRDITAQRVAEETLREREATLRLFIDHAPAALAMFDREMRYLAVSRRWMEDYGLSGDVLGRSHYEIFPEVPERWKEVHRRALRGQVIRAHEDAFPRADGMVQWLRWEVRPWYDHAGEAAGIVIVSEDVTEARKARERLAEERARREVLFEQADIGIVIMDADRTVVDVNERFAAMLGYTPDEAVRLNAWDWDTTYDTPEKFFARWPAMPRTSGTLETSMRRRDGSKFHAEVTWHPARVGDEMFLFTFTRDITERKRAEELLRASEERYRELFEQSPQILWVRDAETHELLAVNRAAVTHYGYSADEFLAMRREDLRCDDEVPTPMGVIAWGSATDRAGEPIRSPPNVEAHRTRDGRTIFVELRTQPIEHGGRPADLVMVTDVTERLRQEAEISALTEGLEERVRERTSQLREVNAELESFSYSVSHDLKAPLRAIDGYSALLEESLLDDLEPEARRLLRGVRDNARRMGRLIEDLLTFSRVGRAAMEEDVVALDDLVRGLVERERELAPDRTIEMEIRGLPPVRGDPTLLRQAFENVIGNAVKFTRPRETARIEVWGAREGDRVAVSVRDNGVGFPPEYGHKLFHVFERLHYSDEFEGTGVGLAIVKRIVERHHGFVSAESALDRGTLVRLHLPAAGRSDA